MRELNAFLRKVRLFAGVFLLLRSTQSIESGEPDSGKNAVFYLKDIYITLRNWYVADMEDIEEIKNDL